jgi:hypothetical protein
MLAQAVQLGFLIMMDYSTWFVHDAAIWVKKGAVSPDKGT